ncbi:nucleotide exchange factor GrpE [Gorillibacterium sp. sgz5001074]|uniref:nucleotide exchange factor GrpE n=1 Tax=Gorillibacterium sp. sgz5001074 TaxID=3446695 RepID=UPI003F678A81
MSDSMKEEVAQAQETENEAVDHTEATYDDQEGKTESGIGSTELEALRKLAEENQERYLRAQADFDNFRRRTRQEKEDFAKYASSKLVEQLLPVLDNFERAIQSSRDSKDFDSLLKGIEMTFRQLDQTLEQEGLKRMDAAGQPFNPDYHQAIMQVESDEYEDGTVVEEVQRGYMFKDRVLRPAMVKVKG